MIIDCDTCRVRGLACGDCVIGVLMGPPTPVAAGRPAGSGAGPGHDDVPSGASTVQFDAVERRAIELLAAQGLIPRLRLVADLPRPTSDRAHTPRPERDAG